MIKYETKKNPKEAKSERKGEGKMRHAYTTITNRRNMLEMMVTGAEDTPV